MALVVTSIQVIINYSDSYLIFLDLEKTWVPAKEKKERTKE